MTKKYTEMEILAAMSKSDFIQKSGHNEGFWCESADNKISLGKVVEIIENLLGDK